MFICSYETRGHIGSESCLFVRLDVIVFICLCAVCLCESVCQTIKENWRNHVLERMSRVQEGLTVCACVTLAVFNVCVCSLFVFLCSYETRGHIGSESCLFVRLDVIVFICLCAVCLCESVCQTITENWRNHVLERMSRVQGGQCERVCVCDFGCVQRLCVSFVCVSLFV